MTTHFRKPFVVTAVQWLGHDCPAKTPILHSIRRPTPEDQAKYWPNGSADLANIGVLTYEFNGSNFENALTAFDWVVTYLTGAVEIHSNQSFIANFHVVDFVHLPLDHNLTAH